MIPSKPGEFEHQRSTVFMEGTYSQRLPPKNDLLTRPATFSNSATKITSHLKKNMPFNHHAILESQIYMVFPPNRDSSNEIPCFSHCWYFTLFWGWFVSFGKRINEENQIKPTTIHTIHTLRRWDSSRAQQVASQTWIDPPSLEKPQRIQRTKARKLKEWLGKKWWKFQHTWHTSWQSRGYKKGVAPEKSSWNYYKPQWKNTEFVVSSKGPTTARTTMGAFLPITQTVTPMVKLPARGIVPLSGGHLNQKN